MTDVTHSAATARDAANVTAYLEASMVPDPDLSIAQGAIAAWPGAWQGSKCGESRGDSGPTSSTG
mgnify:CR=1 FL=1